MSISEQFSMNVTLLGTPDSCSFSAVSNKITEYKEKPPQIQVLSGYSYNLRSVNYDSVLDFGMNAARRAMDSPTAREVDLFLFVENFIFAKDKDTWFDIPFILAFAPKRGVLAWNPPMPCLYGNFSGYGLAMKIPNTIMEKIIKDSGRLERNKIYEALHKEGLTNDPLDPHIDLYGMSRQSILELALQDFLPNQFDLYTKDHNR